ncbi:hypothetical protein E2562_030794 [Oryza meyeriana var. granulata]|uniref:Uncharacterized protein n=1 Tax=Oryza meyeriana var. granulata TaxID=110450 RepID=A0A6G1C8Y2_9ORYZ|nr:hypothetical protein E2562_030794 [Oryza meyeriana var. granulata]
MEGLRSLQGIGGAASGRVSETEGGDARLMLGSAFRRTPGGHARVGRGKEMAVRCLADGRVLCSG